MKNGFTEEELSRMGVERHVHSYRETYGSKRKDLRGNQVREFVCKDCGYIKTITIELSK